MFVSVKTVMLKGHHPMTITKTKSSTVETKTSPRHQQSLLYTVSHKNTWLHFLQ